MDKQKALKLLEACVVDGRIAERFPMTARGWLQCDPRGAQVRFEYRGAVLLGDVREAYFDEQTGVMRLRVTHFNGEPWIIDPPARSVEVLTRTWPKDEQ